MKIQTAFLGLAFAATTLAPAFAEEPSIQSQDTQAQSGLAPIGQASNSQTPNRVEARRARGLPPRAVGRARERGELRRFLRSLDATDAQREVAREEARAAAPISHAARLEGRAIRIEALREHPGDRAAARESARPKIRELRERTLTGLRPLAQKVVATLTPDQRKKLEDAARARGKDLDEARLEKLVSWLLTRPGTLAHLERGARR
jgi:hypothetical protein